MSWKCFSIDIPFIKGQKIMEAHIKFKADIFNGGVRPTYGINAALDDYFFFVTHYQKQLFKHFFNGQRKWPERDKNKSKSYSTRISVRNVEVLQQRNKYKEPCTTGSPDNDDKFIQWITNKIGCTPPYWKFESQLPLCTSQDELNKATELFYLVTQRNSNYIEEQPCRGLEKIQFDSFDIEEKGDKYGTPVVTFQIIFQEFSYKEVKSVPSMDSQTLIGNTTPIFTLQ
jgi:hypothetical protein